MPLYPPPSTAGGGGAAVTASASNGSFTAGLLAFSNANNVTFGTSAGSIISASVAPQTAFVFSNSNGVSFGTNGSTVTATVQTNYLTSQSNQNITAANGGFAFQTLSFSNLNGISFGTSAGSAITASHNAITTARASTDAIGLNTAQSNVTWTVNSSGLSFDARGYAGTGFSGTNISGTVNSNGVSLSVAPGGGGADGYNILAAGTQTANTTGTVKFADSNGISFGMSNSSQITASYTVPSTAGLLSAINVSAGTTSSNQSSIGFSNANGMSFGFSGASITGSYTVPTVTNSVWTVSDAASSATVGRLAFSNLNGVTLSLSTGAAGSHTIVGSHNGLTSQSNQNITAANGGFAFQTLSFSNLNGISFGTSAGSAITASHNAITTARASTDAIGLNTAQSNVTWTVNSSGLSFDARGYAGTGTTFNGANVSGSMTVNSNGVQLSLSAGAGGGATPVASASNGSFSFTTLAFSNANNVTFGTSAGSIITASVAAPGAAAENNWFTLSNVAGGANSSASGSTIGLSGLNLTMSGTNGSQIIISAPATSSLVGTRGISLSTNGSTVSVGKVFQTMYVPMFPVSTVSQTLAALGATSASQRFFPYFVSDNLSFNALRVMHFLSYATSSVSGQQTISYQYALYSNNGSTLSSISSGSFSLAVTNSSVSNTVSYPVSTNTAGYTYTTLAGTATAQLQSLWGTAAAGRPLDLVFGNTMSLSSGQYWLGVHLRHSSTSANIGVSIAYAGNANAQWNSVAPWGISSSAQTTNFNYRIPFMGLGAYTASVSALTNAIPLSQIAHTQTILPLVTFIST